MMVAGRLVRNLVGLVALAVLAAVGTSSAWAQDVTGNISGTVSDASGAVVKGATVTLTNTDRALTVRSVTTSSSGFYTDTLTINSLLKAGAEQSVTITAEQQALNFENSSQGTVIDGTQVQELVLSTRNYEQLVGLQPGVAYTGGDQIYIGNSNPVGSNNTVAFSVNGARTAGNSWTVDGADNIDRGSNLTLLTYPSVDAIAEFKTLRGTFSAEYGRSASGQINVITKSGTTQFHGTAYEFVRNDVFNANSVLNKLATTPSGAVKALSDRSKLRYNDYGYTFGTAPGDPVQPDHTIRCSLPG